MSLFPLRPAKCIASLALLACATAGVLAQQTDTAPHKSTLTVNARLVVLDVVVTDAKGNAITDLTREDFAVYEDGVPQSVRTFESPSAHTLPAQTVAEAATTVFDPARPAAFGQTPVTELVLDQLNTAFADSAFARNSLRDYLRAQPALLAQPTSLLVVYDDHFHEVLGYTRDRDALLHALAAERNHYSWNLALNGISERGPLERLDQTLRALEQIAQSGARIPGRKNVIWVGGGFPTLDPTTVDTPVRTEIRDTIQHITHTLLDTRVTLYAIDPKTLLPGMAEITDPQQAEFADSAGDALTSTFEPFTGDEDFDRLAPLTGGRIVRGMNDVSHQIAVSIALGTNFYTLGYRPSSTTDKASQYRRIRIDIKRPGLTIRTREGYYPESVTEGRSKETLSYDLATAAESPIPLNGLRVLVHRNTRIQTSEPDYKIEVGVPNLTWKAADDGGSDAAVAVMAAWLDSKGHTVGHVLHAMLAHAKPGVNLRDETRTAEFTFTAPTPAKLKGARTLRFVVRDNSTGRMGSFEMPWKAPANNDQE